MTMIQELENRLHYYNMDINVFILMVFKSSWNFELHRLIFPLQKKVVYIFSAYNT